MFKSAVPESKPDVSLLIFGFALICITPFMSMWRTGPLSSFYLESGSLLFALLLVLVSAWTGRLSGKPPAASVYFLSLAAYWWVQARVMHLVYPGMSDMAVWSFVVIALLAWICRGWVVAVGQESVAAVLAWVLVIGALLQSVVCILQFGGWSGQFSGYILSSTANNVMGQLAQRNHLGHYMMWGIVSAAYLWAQRQLPNWLGAVLVVYLTAALGMVNSRTIFVYVALLGMLVVLWRLWAGKSANRILGIMLFALVMVVVVQLSFEKFAALLHIDYLSAMDRLESKGTVDSPRNIEWKRAWTVFSSEPLWGYGWQSYSQQGFLTNVFATGWRNDKVSVLYTHSHNIVFQLLTEMGAVGTLLVFGGFFCLCAGYLKKPVNHASLLPLALLSVSFTHSMLEYPLWYVYFLVPVGIMLSIQPATEAVPLPAASSRVLVKWGVLAVAVFLVTGIVRLGMVYTELVNFDGTAKTDSAEDKARKINGLLNIAETEPMLRYYAQLSLNDKASPSDKVPAPWAASAAVEAMKFRPYANAHTVGLYLYRNGDKPAGERWMRKMYEYYPMQMPYYATVIDANPALSGLRPQLDQACAEYHKVNPELVCPAAPEKK